MRSIRPYMLFGAALVSLILAPSRAIASSAGPGRLTAVLFEANYEDSEPVAAAVAAPAAGQPAGTAAEGGSDPVAAAVAAPAADQSAVTAEEKVPTRAEQLRETHCPKPSGELTEVVTTGTSIAVDAIVSLAGMAVDSVFEALELKLQPEVKTLEAVIGVDGLFDESYFAYENGCLVIHDEVDIAGKLNSNLEAVFQLVTSPDNTAFAFVTKHWKLADFANSKPSAWGQQKGERDIAIKIEFLSPSTEGLGTRKIFVEHVFEGVKRQDLSRLLPLEQVSPWIAMPTNAYPTKSGRHQPVNLRVTMLETTKPKRFAVWLQRVAKDKKTDIQTAVTGAIRSELDATFAAAESGKATEAAGEAFEAYSTAWTAWERLYAVEPADDSNTWPAWKARESVAEALVGAKQVAAQHSFAQAGLPWPGSLPRPKKP